MAQCRECNSIKVFPGLNEGDGKCSVCHGSGFWDAPIVGWLAAGVAGESDKCFRCNGSGECPACDGTGAVEDREKRSDQDESSGLFGGIFGLALGIAFLMLALFVAMSIALTIPIWVGAAATAGIIAYFHAPTVARGLTNTPAENPVVIPRKRNRPPYFRMARCCAGTLTTTLGLSVLAGSAVAFIIALPMGLLNQRDQLSTIIFGGATVLGIIASYRWSKRMYLWRLSELVLEANQLDTGKAGALARTWNALAMLFVGSLCALILVSVSAGSRESLIPRRAIVQAPSVDTRINETLPRSQTSNGPVARESPRSDTAIASEFPTETKMRIEPSATVVGQSRATHRAEGEDFPGERFPQTRRQALSLADFEGWSSADIRYAINEIFARHGAAFPKKDIRAIFAQFTWYHPLEGISLDTIEASLPAVEQWNVQALGAARDSKKTVRQFESVNNTLARVDPVVVQQAPPSQPEYPVANWSLINGCVFSPYPPNRLINISNIPLGNLVTDPSTNETFRAPSQPPNPEMYPIAQWSSVPGNVFSPYQQDGLVNVEQFAAGALVVDPYTNGVFRKPDGSGATVNPDQVLGGFLQGLSQAIQNSGGGQPSTTHRRRRP